MSITRVKSYKADTCEICGTEIGPKSLMRSFRGRIQSFCNRKCAGVYRSVKNSALLENII